ncbi:hypothetical protein HI113_01990 [Corallococcus exiguus]|uniref:hypothetical protein n=1 Tax=Corallococcus exiguus TaxID=83462 RepID=UPI0014730C51|nr:hypothetical protein [Corallococcus exiguus]NNB92683.1 hypothetical protein [Corallococcus exiguus]
MKVPKKEGLMVDSPERRRDIKPSSPQSKTSEHRPPASSARSLAPTERSHDNQVWRIHIRPYGGLANHQRAYDLCLRDGVIGVGWQVDFPEAAAHNLETYLPLAATTHGEHWASGRKAISKLASMTVGNFVWMRSPKGIYHLCKIRGGWEYRDSQENREADIANVRPVEIREVGTEDRVPGSIVACFRPPMTVQSVTASTAILYTQLLWCELGNEPIPTIPAGMDIFDLLSSEDVEDVIFVFLQTQGWIVRPSRRRRETIAYEFTMAHPDGREAVVQVKTGQTKVDLSAMPDTVDVAFAFQPRGLVTGTNVKACIVQPERIMTFMKTSRRLLPGTVQTWLDAVSLLESRHK